MAPVMEMSMVSRCPTLQSYGSQRCFRQWASCAGVRKRGCILECASLAWRMCRGMAGWGALAPPVGFAAVLAEKGIQVGGSCGFLVSVAAAAALPYVDDFLENRDWRQGGSVLVRQAGYGFYGHFVFSSPGSGPGLAIVLMLRPQLSQGPESSWRDSVR